MNREFVIKCAVANCQTWTRRGYCSQHGGEDAFQVAPSQAGNYAKPQSSWTRVGVTTAIISVLALGSAYLPNRDPPRDAAAPYPNFGRQSSFPIELLPPTPPPFEGLPEGLPNEQPGLGQLLLEDDIAADATGAHPGEQIEFKRQNEALIMRWLTSEKESAEADLATDPAHKAEPAATNDGAPGE